MSTDLSLLGSRLAKITGRSDRGSLVSWLAKITSCSNHGSLGSRLARIMARLDHVRGIGTTRSSIVYPETIFHAIPSKGGGSTVSEMRAGESVYHHKELCPPPGRQVRAIKARPLLTSHREAPPVN
ncbi:hypothetical protein RRG08_000194 [Elysia crispata]|uniref:Uncharacterized protein n=1 Tax=Elysia crispata TaxID=231223 RepID=A0AAE0YV93_9GAST|nr:hypothetical protein RRG08_000194 [Elysia crispata]